MINKFESPTLGAPPLADPQQPIFTLDHNVQDKSAANLVRLSVCDCAFYQPSSIIYQRVFVFHGIRPSTSGLRRLRVHAAFAFSAQAAASGTR